MKIRYTRFESEERILRDFLAIDRTTLANERTVLSFIRTALTFLVVGASAVKFLDSVVLVVLGWVFIVTGIGLGAWGVFRFFEAQRRIEEAIRMGPEEVREAVRGGEKERDKESDGKEPDGDSASGGSGGSG